MPVFLLGATTIRVLFDLSNKNNEPRTENRLANKVHCVSLSRERFTRTGFDKILWQKEERETASEKGFSSEGMNFK